MKRTILLGLIGSSIGLSIHASHSSATTLVGYWSLNENTGAVAGDSSANALHGTLTGLGVTWTPGQLGSGLNFDNTIDRVVVPYDPAMNYTTSFSLAFWINAPANQQGVGGEGIAAIIDKSHGGGMADGWVVHGRAAHGGAITIAVGTGATFPEPQIPGVLTNSWHHVAVTVSLKPNLRIRGYVDGTLVTDFSDPATTLAANTRDLLFGAWYGAGGPVLRQFEGNLDEIRLYNGVLTACEIAALANPAGFADCNGNFVPDSCEIAKDEVSDCNNNGISDSCDIANCPPEDVACADCNGNSVPDECDITAVFVGLGDLPGGSIESHATGVSGDGTVVAGWSATGVGTEAFRWAEDYGMVGLGDLSGGIFFSQANGISSDGSVVIGISSSASGNEAIKWTMDDGLIGLGDLPGGSFSSVALGVSADGLTAVGLSVSSSGNEAMRWTAGGGMTGLGDLSGGIFFSQANGVSGDGTAVVGRSVAALGNEAFLWTSGNGMVGLGDLPGGNFFSKANAISSDGTTVVGQSNSSLGNEAFRWTSGGGMVGLGDLTGGDFQSEALGVSTDGSVVVGSSSSTTGVQAFRWSSNDGMQSVQETLTNEYGLNLTGWNLYRATGVSNCGRTIVGDSINPSSRPEAWLARLPTSKDCNSNGVPDECELVGHDCNSNDIPDDCEMLDDCNNNGTPDLCETPPAGVLLVRADAPPGGDGLNWATPFATLQGALSAAAGSGGSISQIWVAGGVYRPDQTEANPIGTGDRNATFQLLNGVAIYGGFACGDDELTDRDPVANATILDGAVHIFSDSFTTNPSLHWSNERGAWAVQGDEYVATAPSNSPATYSVLPMALTNFVVEVNIRGVTDGGIWLRSPSTGVGVLLITGGGFGGTGLYWHVVSPDSNYGPALGLATGLFTPGDDIHLRIVVSGNDYRAYLNGAATPATTLNTGAFALGRVGVYSNSAQRFDNFRVGQGAYHVVNGSGVNATAILDGFTITGGNADGAAGTNERYGGGMIIQQSGSPTMRNCRFIANRAYEGGAVYNSAHTAVFTACEFDRNTSIGSGGAISSNAGSMSVTDSDFTSNESQTGVGGAMHFGSGSSSELIRCRFLGNRALTDAGGAINLGAQVNVLVTNCLFSGNEGSQGGAINSAGGGVPTSNLIVINSTMSRNYARNTVGGAIHMGEGSLTLSNSILWGNLGDTSNTIYLSAPGTPTEGVISFSDVQGVAGPTPPILGIGNINANPYFIDADGADEIPGTEDDDLHLPVWSPCVDAGDPVFVPQPGETDLDGDDRVIGCRVDLGADEVLTGGASTGDMDASGDTDLDDVPLFVNALLYASPNCAADINADGSVDGQDIAPFIDLVAP